MANISKAEDNGNFRRMLFIVFACLFFSAELLCATPEIVCKTPTYDFGKLEGNKKVDHVFTIWNEGDEPLQLGKHRACCGGKISMVSKVIAPGTNATCKVSFFLRGRRGKQNKSFYIASNDAKQPYFKLTLTGEVLAPVYLSPRYVKFGNISADAPVEKELKLMCQANLMLNITNAISDNRKFDVKTSKLPEGDGYTVVVSTLPPMPVGVTRGKITILTDNPKYPSFKFSVIATVASEFIVVPREIVLVDKKTEMNTTRYLAVRSRDKNAFKVTGMNLPDPKIKTEHTYIDESSCRIKLSNIIPFQDMDGTHITINTDNPKAKEITVPIRVVSGDE